MGNTKGLGVWVCVRVRSLARAIVVGAAVVGVLAGRVPGAGAADIVLILEDVAQGHRAGPVSAATGDADELDELVWQEFVSVDGSEDWHTTANWSDNRLPGPLDNAAVRYGGPARLNGDSTVRNLIVDNSSTLYAHEYRLGVTETATIGVGTIEIEGPLGVLDVDALHVDNEGIAFLRGGSIDATMMTITAGGTLFGYGQAEVAEDLVNDGTITAVTEELTLTSVGGRFDLDGTGGNGKVEVAGSDLTINGPLTGEFDGTMIVGRKADPHYTWSWGRTLTLSEGWVLGEGGTVDLIGQPNVPAVIDSPTMVVRGQITAVGSGEIVSNVTLKPTARISLPNVDDHLTLGGATEYEGGSFTGNGTLKQDDDAIVLADTTIETGIYDWDGQSGSLAFMSIGSARLTINASQIDTGDPQYSGYNGTVMLLDGALAVNTAEPWILDGTITMISGTVTGQKILLHGTVEALPFLSGTTNQIDADIEMNNDGDGTISVGAGCVLALNGEVSYSRGTVEGDGTLVLNGNARMASEGGRLVIDVATFDWDGSQEAGQTDVGYRGTMTINSSRIDVGPLADDGFDGRVVIVGGVLAVNTPEPWRMDGTMTLTEGTVTGQEMVVHGGVNVELHPWWPGPKTGTINADVTFENGSTTTVDDTCSLELNGRTLFRQGATLAVGTREGAQDVLVATGQVTIEPNVSLTLNVHGGGNEFMGGVYTLISTSDGGALAGQFTHVTDLGPYATAGPSGDGLIYTADSITLMLDMDLNPADGNLDGMTDVSDRIIWNSNNFTFGTTFTTGDYNNDGQTDVSDRIIWNNNNFTFAQRAATPVVAVPEPATMALLSLAGACMFLRRRTPGRGARA